MKFNTNSNVYTIVYASVMVIIAAFLLAFVASVLKSPQEANVANVNADKFYRLSTSVM